MNLRDANVWLRSTRTFRAIRRIAANEPLLFFPIARFSGNRNLVSEQTDIVIDGYPRCANSFAEAAFRLAQLPDHPRLAHHAHSAAQVVQALRFEIPVVVLFRNPDEAVLSYKAVLPDRVRLLSLYQEYNSYYSRLLDYIPSCVLCSFDRCTTRFDSVIAEVNDVFGCSFRVPVFDADFVARVKQMRDDTGAARTGRVPTYSELNSDSQRLAARAKRNRIRAALEEIRGNPRVRRAHEVFEQLKLAEHASMGSDRGAALR